MKKTSNEKPTVALHANMNKKNLSLNTKKADTIKSNIVKQLEVIYKSFNEIDAILNRLNMKRYVADDSTGFVVQCAKKCVSQAQATRSLIMNLEMKYNEDQKTLIIQDLDDRISFLEERLAKMK